jgi:hypothetical protein
VLPAIERDHNAQQQLVYEHHNATLAFVHTYAQWTERLLEAREMEGRSSHLHKTCRTEEHTLKIQTQTCDTELRERWEKVQEVEEDMDDLSERIQTEWCAPGVNRTEEEFRDEAVKKFGKYSHKKTTIHEVTTHYQEFVSVCQSNHTLLHSKRTECEEEQRELETSACLAGDLTREASSKLTEEWPMIASIYNDTITSVRKAEVERKKEFSTLVTVECLLQRIEELGGQPCEDGNSTGGGVTREIEICHNKSSNITHLVVVVPPMVEEPHAPEPRPQPCTDEFIAQEYMGMEVAECRPCESGPQTSETSAINTPAPTAIDPNFKVATTTLFQGHKAATTTTTPVPHVTQTNFDCNKACFLAPDGQWGAEDIATYVDCLKFCCQDYDHHLIFDGIPCAEVRSFGISCENDEVHEHNIPAGTKLKDICGVTCGVCPPR